MDGAERQSTGSPTAAIGWQVDGGTGPLAGATGIVTSNFTVSGAGEVVDNQWGVLFVAD